MNYILSLVLNKCFKIKVNFKVVFAKGVPISMDKKQSLIPGSALYSNSFPFTNKIHLFPEILVKTP